MKTLLLFFNWKCPFREFPEIATGDDVSVVISLSANNVGHYHLQACLTAMRL